MALNLIDDIGILSNVKKKPILIDDAGIFQPKKPITDYVYDALSMETGRPDTVTTPAIKKAIPTISTLTPEKEARSRQLTDVEIKQYRTQKNIELAKKYPKNYLTGSSARIESFAKGLLPASREALPDVEKAYPITHAAGQLAGLLPAARLVRGVSPIVTTAKAISTLPTIARIAAGKIAQTGITFGIKEFIDNMAELYAGEDKSAGEVVKKTLKSAAFGGGLGLAGVPASPLVRIPSEMGYGFMTAKIQGADNLNAGINAGLFGLFGLFNAKNLSNAYKTEAYNGSKRALVDRLVEKGIDTKKASTVADRYFQYAMNRTGGWNKAKIKDFDAFSKAMKKGWNIIIEPEMGATTPPPTQPIPPTLLPPTTTPTGAIKTPPPDFVGPKDILPEELQITQPLPKLIKKPDTSVADYQKARGDVSSFDLATHGLLNMTPAEITTDLTSRLTKAGVNPEIIKGMDIRRPSDISIIKKMINDTMLKGVNPQVAKDLHKARRVLLSWQDEQVKKLASKNKNVLIQMRDEINSGDPGSRIKDYGVQGQGGTPDVIGIPSTYPDYFRNKGLVAKDTISWIDKLMKGERLAEGQQAKMEDLIRDKRAYNLEQARIIRQQQVRERMKPEKIPAGELAIGDEFRIKGEKFNVTGEDSEGNLIIKDGKTIVADPFTIIPIDKGDIKSKPPVAPKPPALDALAAEFGKKGVIPDAETIRKNEGQVQKGGIVRQVGQAEGAPNLQRQPEVGAEAGYKRGQVAPPEIGTPVGIQHPKIQPSERINDITLAEAGRLIKEANPKVIHSIQEGVQAKGSLAMQDAIRNEEMKVIQQAKKGPEREAVKAKIQEIEPEINKALMGKMTVAEQISSYNEPAPIFFSQMQRVLESKLPNKGPASAFREMIKVWANKGEFKQEEHKWSGVDEWLAGQKGMVTKREVIEWLKGNEVRVEEVEKGRYAPLKWGTEDKFGVLASDDQLKMSYEVVKSDDGGLFIATNGQPHEDVTFKSVAEAKAYLEDLHREDFKDYGDKATKFSRYTTPGGQHYRELLLMLPWRPEHGTESLGKEGQYEVFMDGEFWGRFATHDDAEQQVGALRSNPNNAGHTFESRPTRQWKGLQREAFRSPHWDEPNVLAHVRFNERQDADGNRVLFIEEIQSDWAGERRRQGFKDELTDDEKSELKSLKTIVLSRGQDKLTREQEDRLIALENKGGIYAVPNAPLLKNWQELVLKRILRYAAENNFDKISCTTGAMQQDRYDLSKQVFRLDYEINKDGSYDLSVLPKDGDYVTLATNVAPNKLADYVGKDVALKIINKEGEEGESNNFFSLASSNLKVGGKWAENLYDQMIPQFFNKYGKKWGAKVEDVRIGTRDIKLRVETSVNDLPLSRDAQEILNKVITSSQYNVSEQSAAKEVLQKLKEGWSVGSALEEHGNISLGKILGVEMAWSRDIYISVQSYPITPSMKQSILYEGQQLFEKSTGYGKISKEKAYENAKRELDQIYQQQELPFTRRGVGDRASRRPQGEILAAGIRRDLVNKGRIDLRGQKAETTKDIAIISQVFRSPKIETFRIGFIKDGKVVAQIGMSSRMPGLSQSFIKNPKKEYYEILHRAKRLGADSIYFLHNHPSGDPTPSQEDVNMTATLINAINRLSEKSGAKVPRFMGHVIINSGKYAVIEPKASYVKGEQVEAQILSLPIAKKDEVLTPEKAHEYLSAKINGFEDVARIGQAMKQPENLVTLIYRGSKGGVRMIESISTNRFADKEHTAGYIRNMAREFGAVDVFAYYDGPEDYKEIATGYMRSGILRDAIYQNRSIWYGDLPTFPKGMWMGKKAGDMAVSVSEEGEGYNLKGFIKNIRDTRKLKEEGVIIPTPKEVVFFDNAVKRLFTYPATLSKRFPKFKVIYERTVELFKERDIIAVELINQVNPYFNLTDEVKVNEFLEHARKEGRKFKVTPESMAEYGLSDIEQEAVMAVRKTMDISLNKLKDMYMEVAQSIENAETQAAYITNVEKVFKELSDANYVPFGRFGDKYLAVMDNEGNLVAYYLSNKQSELVELTHKYDRGRYKVKIGEVLKTSDEAFTDIPLNIMTALKKLDADTLGLELSKKLAQELGGFPEHLIHAKLTPGHSQDFKRSIADYILGISNYIAHKKARRDYMNMIGEINPKSERGLYEYAKRYTEYISKPVPEAHMLRKLMFYYYIGPNIKTNLVNLTQTFSTTYPVLARYTKSPGIQTMKALKLYKDYLLHRAKFRETHHELSKAIQEAITDGTLSEQMVRELSGQARPDKLSTAKLDKVMGAMMAAGEHVNRTTAFIAGFNVAKADGKSYEDAIKFAEQLSNDTQFIYSKLNRPEIMRGRKAALFIFRNFTGNYLSLLKEAGRDKEYGQLVRMLIVMGLLAGVSGFVGVKELFKALEIGGVDVKTKIKELIPGKTGDVILHGAPWLLGVDLSGSIGVGELVPDIEEGLYPAIGKGITGVVADIPARAIKAGTRLKEGQPYRAVESLMPEWARNPMVAYRWGKEDVRFPSGERIAIPTIKDIALKSIGIQPSRLSSAYERENAERLLKEGAYSGDINRRYARAKFLNDEEEIKQIRLEIERHNKGAKPERHIRLNPVAVKHYLHILRSDESEIKQMPKKTRRRYREIQEIYRQ